MTDKNNHIIIIGGGAAGMLAAIIARRQGARVTILERNPRVGKKILATGNGRCNYTNVNADINCYHGHNREFAHSPLAQFTVEETIDFFEELGIAHKVEELGKVFPMSDQASSVLDVLRYELEKLNVTIVCDAPVKTINFSKKNFVLELKNGIIYQAHKVIIATGGKAMPASGSDGSGYDLALQLGHSLTPIFPGLVQLKLEGSFFKQIQGVKFVGTAEILHKNQSLAQDRGDILFANYGVSGPPILQISRQASQLITDGKEPTLKIAIIDTMTKEELSSLLEIRFAQRPEKTLDFSLVGLINKRLIPVMLKEADLGNLKRPVASLNHKEKERIAHILTDWRFPVRGTRSWPSAQVTCGGINTDEVNPSTMESKLVPGLYFAGEILDIDGLCGGFNLQWAWSSGYVAGKNGALA